MRLQHFKCAYCERILESDEVGKVEWDLEHFRPKGEVGHWTHPDVSFATGSGRDQGYYMLSYHLLNYLAACKPCNSTLKHDHFPIEGVRGPANAEDPHSMVSEKPLFVYPLGDIDHRPTDLITYYGYRALPKRRRGRKYRRAKAMILAFDLNRETLELGRARQIETMWFALEVIKSSTDPKKIKQAQKTIARLKSRKEAHTGCSRAFHQLWTRDPEKASKVYDLVFRRLNPA